MYRYLVLYFRLQEREENDLLEHFIGVVYRLPQPCCIILKLLIKTFFLQKFSTFQPNRLHFLMGLVARNHSLLDFPHYIHSYTFIHNIRSSFLIAVRSVRGPTLGCRAQIRTRGRLTAARRVTNWGTPQPIFIYRYRTVNSCARCLTSWYFLSGKKLFYKKR